VNPLPPIGERRDKYTVTSHEGGSMIRVRCDCGSVRQMTLSHWHGENPRQCISCLSRERKAKATNIAGTRGRAGLNGYGRCYPPPDRTSEAELVELRAANAGLDLPPPPRNRSECRDGPRPCPHASCRYSLLADITDAGSVLHVFPDREIEELADTCALDVADRGGATLQEVGRRLNVTRERIRQIEFKAFRKLRHNAPEVYKLLAKQVVEQDVRPDAMMPSRRGRRVWD